MVPTSSHHKNDSRFTLTDSERQAVQALKEACDKDGVVYKHVFELAKYALATHSSADDTNPKAAEIRLQAALTRMKKRNSWRQKHGMDQIDPHAALVELESLYPGYFFNTYSQDSHGHMVVAHHHAHPPTDFVLKSKQNLAKYLVAEQYRLDLGAADMEEARRGICMVSITEGQLTTKRAYKYIRLVAKAADNLKDMHSNRIKQIYSEVPSFLSHLIRPAKIILPQKVASRINVVGSLDDLDKFLEHDSKKNNKSAQEWALERLEKYQETVARLVI